MEDLSLPDMVLASIEIGRRAYEFRCQYIDKVKNIKKNIISPDIELFNNLIVKSLEEFDLKVEQFKSFIDMYYFFKKSKLKYRLSLDDFDLKF